MNIRIIRKTHYIATMTKEQAEDLIQYNDDEPDNVFMCRGWSPKVDGIRDHFFVINWSMVAVILEDPDFKLMFSAPVIRALVLNKGAITAANNVVVWESA